jgi:hypothetical protein
MRRGRLALALAIIDGVAFIAFSVFVDPHPDYIAVAAYAVGIASFVAVGVLLVSRVPTNPIGGLLLAAGTFTVASSALWSFARLGSSQVPPWLGSAFVQSLGDGLFLSPIVIALVDVPLVFPDGRLPSPRFRWVVVTSIVLMIAWAVGAITQTGVIGAVVLLTLLVSFSGAAIAVSLRFRRGDPVQRQQVKGLAAAVIVAGVFFPTGFLLWNTDPGLSNALVGVGLLALFALPVVIGIAILRHRLYEIDRIISRTIAYVVITGILVAAYASAILLLQDPLGRITGGDTISVAMSTLVVAALFQPLRRRIQAVVDQRFDRARFDAERTTADFFERLRDEVDIAAVTADLNGTVRSALNPRTLGLWLRGTTK